MDMARDLISQEEIERCLRHISHTSNNRVVEEPLLKLLRDMEIYLDEPKVEDSIDGARIHITYTVTIRKKQAGTDWNTIRFQYIKEMSIDYNNMPISLRHDYTEKSGYRAEDDSAPPIHKNANAEDTIIESYQEIEKGIPTLCEILGLLKRVYYMPEDFSNRLVIDRVHRLRNMFSKEEILALPSININDKSGLIPI
jgi:hypothetical protein